MYSDEKQVRQLYRLLKSDHVGGSDNVELYLRFAQFELRLGKTDKCAAILEEASQWSSLAGSEALRRAMVEFKLLGTFKIEPLLSPNLSIPMAIDPIDPMDYAEPVADENHHQGNTVEAIRTASSKISTMQTKFAEPPTPMSQPTLFAGKIITPIPNINADPGRDTVPSSGIKATEEQRAALSCRLRRLGLGPPKRAVLGGTAGTIITSDSPNDSTVPRRVEPSPLPMIEDEKNSHSPFNSPSKTVMMAIDKENMSLTTVYPLPCKKSGLFLIQYQSFVDQSKYQLDGKGQKRQGT